MSQYFRIHPERIQGRLIRQAVEIVRQGGVIAYPTDSGYALGCQLGDKTALKRICQIRNLRTDHNFTLIVRDLSESATYAHFNNRVFRLLKAHTPGPYTFILEATKEVPRRLLHPKRKTIGMRVPDHPIALALLAELDEPMMTTSLILPGDDLPMVDAVDIRERLEKQIDLVIDGDFCGAEATTLIDLTGDEPEVVRVGLGDPTPFE
jgi:tRNA threonylcarbamoyl adenosine modification protein (Sua5/YciO/YrdC/YwlC family)